MVYRHFYRKYMLEHHFEFGNIHLAGGAKRLASSAIYRHITCTIFKLAGNYHDSCSLTI